ncbi:MAG TPA: hypothetical protein V6D06_02420 [Trichocoleus sp.]
MKEQITRWIGWILVADLAVVLLAFGWFMVAVLGKSMQVDLGLELWYSLWNPLILPAISILMAGAIASGVMGWVGQKLEAFKAKDAG